MMQAAHVFSPDTLRRAIENHELVLHYQPKINLESRFLTGLEALMRWNHPTFGLLQPGEFIPALETTGLIVKAERWAIAEAVRQMQRWSAAGMAVRIAVNVGRSQFASEGFVEFVRDVLTDGRPNNAGLDLEVPEPVVAGDDIARNMELLAALRELDIGIAIDHFGTGVSLLPHLARAPIQSLKLDRFFHEAAIRDPRSEAVLGAVISLAHSLALTVIAKGVESEAQWQLLQRLGCDELQGYLFSPARPASNIERVLQMDKQLRAAVR